MVLYVMVFQFISPMLAICLCQLSHDEVHIKRLVQACIFLHPARGLVPVLCVSALHVGSAANVSSAVDHALDAVNEEYLALAVVIWCC